MADDEDRFREVVGEHLWREAEDRAHRDLIRSRRRARFRLAARKLPAVAVTLLLLGLTGWFLGGHPQDDLSATIERLIPPKDPPAPSETADARTPAPAAPVNVQDDPYAGTPAERFPPGLILPPATAVGGHGKDEVAAAIARTATLLTTARLDARLLAARDGGPYAEGLAPNYRLELAGRAARQHRPADGITALAPGQRLLAPPRAQGTMRAAAGPHGELTIVTNYVFVYPLKPSHPVTDRMSAHVVVRADATYTFYSGKRYAAGDRGVWLTLLREYWSNIACAAGRQGLIALPETADLAEGAGESEKEREADYDPARPIPSRDGCQLLTPGA